MLRDLAAFNFTYVVICYENLLHSILHRWSYATRPCCIQFYIGGHMLRELAAFNFT